MHPARRRLAAVLVLPVALAALVAAATSFPRGGHPVRPPTVRAPAPGGVAGYLYADRDDDGRHDDDEPLLGGRAVAVLSTGPLPLRTTRTRADGSFRFSRITDLAAGTTEVRIRTTPFMEGPAARAMPRASALSQSVTVRLGSVTAVAVTSYRLCTRVDRCPGLDPPDLRPVVSGSGGDEEYPAPSSTEVDTRTRPGRVLLRFASATRNDGGLLHVVAQDPGPADRRQEVYQRVYGDGVVLLHQAGRFVYLPGHRHVHLDEFERYDLLDADGTEVLRTSGKVSFCLTDVQRVDRTEPPEGTVRLELPPMACGALEQGIDPGWADYYGRSLPDQWIDVTGLPSATHRVRFTVDPHRHLLDADRSNDSAWFRLDYRAPGGETTAKAP